MPSPHRPAPGTWFTFASLHDLAFEDDEGVPGPTHHIEVLWEVDSDWALYPYRVYLFAPGGLTLEPTAAQSQAIWDLVREERGRVESEARAQLLEPPDAA